MAQAPDIRNTIAARLWTLLEAQATITSVVYPANRNKGTEAGWLRDFIARSPADRRRLSISFSGGTNSLGESTTSFDDYRRTHTAVIRYVEPLPDDPGVHPIQEAIEQTLFLAGQDLGLSGVESRGPLAIEIRPTRDNEFPTPGRFTEFRLPIVTNQSLTEQASLTV